MATVNVWREIALARDDLCEKDLCLLSGPKVNCALTALNLLFECCYHTPYSVFSLQNSVRHTLSVRQRFVRLPRMLNGNISHKSWWTLSNDFLRRQAPVEPSPLKPTLQAVNEKQATQGTQTDELICGWCAGTVVI